MAQNNGLLVDVDIETATVGTEKVENNSSVTLGGSDEVNSNVSNNKNIYDKIDTIQTYQNSLEIEASEERRQRDRINSVDSTQSIRSYDSTGMYIPFFPHVLHVYLHSKLFSLLI